LLTEPLLTSQSADISVNRPTLPKSVIRGTLRSTLLALPRQQVGQPLARMDCGETERCRKTSPNWDSQQKSDVFRRSMHVCELWAIRRLGAVLPNMLKDLEGLAEAEGCRKSLR